MPGFIGVFVGVMVRVTVCLHVIPPRRLTFRVARDTMVWEQNDATGKVLDHRPVGGRPSFNELIKRPSTDLKQMWKDVRSRADRTHPPHMRCGALEDVSSRAPHVHVLIGVAWCGPHGSQGITKQMEDLIQHEGEDAPLLVSLRAELKEVRASQPAV